MDFHCVAPILTCARRARRVVLGAGRIGVQEASRPPNLPTNIIPAEIA